MVKFVSLKRESFEGAKIAVKRGKLYGEDVILDLAKYTFDEILKYMEEHGFRNSVDSSYLQFDGFYLIERILNVHISRIYKKVFSFASKPNKVLLDGYYLKYQVHNMVALVRCYIAKEDEVEPFLIGDERRKQKYIKAFEMPNIEDAIVYISKKLSFDSKKVLEAYSNGIYEFENYLYKLYYEKLESLKFKYNNLDEKKFFNFIHTYVDLINARTFMKLKVEKIESIKFEDIFIEGGNLSHDFFNELTSLDIQKSLENLDDYFGKVDVYDNSSSVANIDKRINIHKSEAEGYLKISNLGSPFFVLKYLFEVESEIGKLRILLKAKYLELEESEIVGLIR